MKTLPVVLVVVLLCVERASALHCYKCDNVQSLQDCHSTRCADTQKYCVTQTTRKSDYPRWISKGCSETCTPQSTKGSEVIIDCCQQDNCNTGGSASVKASSAVLGLGTLASFFYVLRTGL